MTLANQVVTNGFAIFPEAFTLDEISHLSNELTNSDLRKTRAGIRHALKHPAVSLLARSERLCSMARSILGDTALPFRATLFDKSFASNWLVVWHQDTALPLCNKKEIAGWGPWSMKDGIVYAHAPARALSTVLALRVHLDECSPYSGPLRVLPQTHKHGVLSDEQISTFTKQIKAIDCIVPRGGVLAMTPLLIHSSSKSLEGMRRVLHIEYAASTVFEEGLQLAVT